jgi:hypothetical protein
VELEKGWPITIYANQQKTGNQLYFRLVRDRNWNIIGSARQKIFGQKLKGLQIWEGVETSFVKKVHITNVKISVGAYFFVVSLPHDDARQIKQVSCVIHNGSIVLMLPAVKFDGYMRFIANLVMEACEKGTFSQEIREKAEDIYKAYVLEDMQKVQEEQFALLKLLGKPLRGQDDLMG